jgi:hypothetical protein
MLFKELEKELEWFNKLPIWGKVLIKIYADTCYVIGFTLTMLMVFINYMINKESRKKGE